MAENSDQILHFHEYFNIIRNRLWVIFTIFILTVASGAYVTEEVIPKTYTASSEIQIQHEGKADSIGLIYATPNMMVDALDFEADYQKMQSPDVLQPII